MLNRVHESSFALIFRAPGVALGATRKWRHAVADFLWDYSMRCAVGSPRPQPSLDGKHAIFGRIKRGMKAPGESGARRARDREGVSQRNSTACWHWQVVQKIGSVATNAQDALASTVVPVNRVWWHLANCGKVLAHDGTVSTRTSRSRT